MLHLRRRVLATLLLGALAAPGLVAQSTYQQRGNNLPPVPKDEFTPLPRRFDFTDSASDDLHTLWNRSVAAGTGFITLFYLLGVPLIMFEGGFRVFGFTLLALWIVIGKVCWMLGFGALLLSKLGQDEASAAAPSAGTTPAGVYPPPAPSTM